MARTKVEDTETKKQTYDHYIRPVVTDPDYEKHWKLEHHLIKTYDELMDFYKNKFKPDSFFAFDTETTSLNPEQGIKTGDLVEGIIVGYSFSQDGRNGYYVAVQHPDYAIGYKALKVLYAMLTKSKLVLMYNARFDMRYLEFMTPEKYGYIPEQNEKIYKFDLSNIKYFDVQCSVWLADTNVPMPSLKKSEKHFLGWLPPTFNDTTGGETNFGYLPAEQGYRYASLDALSTYNLFFKTEKYYTESGAAGKLDNEVLYPLMKLENTPIYVDNEYLQSMRGDVLKHLEELKNYLYTEAGCEYNINSGRELIRVFQNMGIDTGKRTKTGMMETNIKAITGYLATNGNNENDTVKYLKKLIEYKQLLKFDNSYLEKLIEMSKPEEVQTNPIRFCYFTSRVPTGRLASGTDGKNKFFAPCNFQSIPKPHSHMYYVHKATDEQIANKEDLCGYIFDDNPENSLGIAEGQDPHLNVRKCFAPKPGEDAVVVSVDMCAEELRLVANVFKEQTWINAFNTGQDVHKMTAIKIFGEDKYCKEARKKAKTASFGILYGSSAYGFHNSFPDMTLEECEDFIDKFKAALPNIEAGQKSAVRFAKKNGFVKTYFGRPRRVKYYMEHPDRSMRSFGERTCKNTVVQGCAGDLLKLMLIRLYKDLYTKYPEVKWLGTIHDEINCIVPKNILIDVLKIIKRCQTIQLPDWPVVLECDLSFGKDFGSLFSWELNEETGQLIPKMEPIKKDEPMMIEETKKDDYTIALEEDDYDYMQ